MQASIYFDDSLLRRVDREARRRKKTRSKFIQSVLEEKLTGQEKSSVFDEIFGILDEKEADELLQTIYSGRRNSSRFK